MDSSAAAEVRQRTHAAGLPTAASPGAGATATGRSERLGRSPPNPNPNGRAAPPRGKPRAALVVVAVLLVAGLAFHAYVMRSERCQNKCEGEMTCCYESWFEKVFLCSISRVFGCQRWTPACVRGCDFLPEGLVMNRPCCQKHIRTTMQYVLDKLAENNIAYMIDRGVVLSSLRVGDIHPWDPDGDVVILADPDRKMSSLGSVREAQHAISRIFGKPGAPFGPEAYGTNADGYYFRGSDILHSGINRFYIDFFIHTFVGVDEDGNQLPGVPINRTHLYCAKYCSDSHPTASAYPVDEVLPLGKCGLFDRPQPCPGRPIEFLMRVYNQKTPADLLTPIPMQSNTKPCPENDPYCGRDIEADKAWIREATCTHVHARGWPSFCQYVDNHEL